MKKTLIETSKKIMRATLVNLGTIAVSLPVLAICLVLTFSAAFWLYDAIGYSATRYISRRVILLLLFPGCMGSLILNGYLVYRISHYLEERLS